AFDPDFAVFEIFFFPDGNDFFELVDRVVAGVEGGAAVGGRDDDSDAGFADVEMPEAVDHGNAVDVPGLAHENTDLLEFPESHRLVRLINEMQGALTLGIVPDDTF